jgi:rhamnulokinase
MVAIDLGAESCRVSLLQGRGGEPAISMVRRFANGPVEIAGRLHWDLENICDELEAGLRECAKLAPEGIASIGVTGWAVDYVRLNGEGRPLAQPYCYRDARNVEAMEAVHRFVAAEALYGRTGVQTQPINTVYQLYADKIEGDAKGAWVNLPEYILHWLGAPRVAEWTNATHTGLVDPETREWAWEIFDALGLERGAAPRLVEPGSVLGPMRGELRKLKAFAETKLIAPACHDTASAIAGIAAGPGEWAYISSGTWSLVGMLLAESHRTKRAGELGFTNLGAAGGGVLFHRGMVGMWLLRQCMNTWDAERSERRGWTVAELIEAARKLPAPDSLLDLEDAAFTAPGNMPKRINAQRKRRGLAALAEGGNAAPAYANLIFHSLAGRYAAVLKEIEELTGRRPERICVVGGGNRNEYLNALTAQATGLPVERGAAESSTIGNFAVQWARLEQTTDGVAQGAIAEKARALRTVAIGD